MTNIIIIAAHPDDEVLGCGGTISKLSQMNDIYILILSKGVASRDLSEDKKREEQSRLRNEMSKANKILGAKKVFTEEFPDNMFDTVPLLNIIKTIQKYVEMVNPEIVYTHHRGDLNIDHCITFNAVLTACRPIKGNSVKKIFSFEIPSSTEWNFQAVTTSFNPNVFEEISETIDKKVEAMSAYENEIRLPPHPRSILKIRSLAETRGAAAGMNYAEAFELIRELRT